MKRLFTVAGALALAAMLSACASGTAPVPTAGGDAAAIAGAVEDFGGKVDAAEGKLADFTQADLEAAKADADAHNDVIASTCYAYILTVLPVITQNAQDQDVKGVFSAFQKARNIIKRGQEGISDELTLNCGPLYLDAKRDVKGVPGMIAGLASKLGVKAFLPF